MCVVAILAVLRIPPAVPISQFGCLLRHAGFFEPRSAVNPYRCRDSSALVLRFKQSTAPHGVRHRLIV